MAPNEHADSRTEMVNSPYLCVVLVHDGERTSLIVGGELDSYTSMAFERALLKLEHGVEARPLTLDLSRLRFVDLSGVRAVVAAQRRAHRAGCELHVIEPSGPAARLFELARCHRMFRGL